MKLKYLEIISGTQLKASCGKQSKGRIAVMMSGGVDSSVSALKLQEEGWDVVGVNMRIPLACGGGEVDCAGVEEVARRLEIPLYQINLTGIFQHEVIDNFEREYRKGRTPNPCCDCNRRLKFGFVWDVIEEELGIKNLATGHYARVLRRSEGVFLARGLNEQKDQSYFIYGIAADRLPYFYLPLGDLSKDDTRRLAKVAGLTVAEKSESMELCFAGGGDYREAFSTAEDAASGDFVDSDFNVIGKHNGVRNYTVGQRKLGMSFGPEPSYVLQVIPERNMVMVGKRAEAYKKNVKADLVVVHRRELLIAGSRILGKIRSGGTLIGCEVAALTDNVIEVVFDKELFAPTPGQHLVLYADDSTVIAGGTIS